MSDPAHTADFFRQPLAGMIDLGHPLAALAAGLSWTQIEAALPHVWPAKQIGPLHKTSCSAHPCKCSVLASPPQAGAACPSA